MGGIIMKAAPALSRLAAPSRLGPAQHDRAIGFRQCMADCAERSAGKQPGRLGEGPDIAVVVADLSDESLGLRQLG